jgi:hypothetical protein
MLVLLVYSLCPPGRGSVIDAGARYDVSAATMVTGDAGAQHDDALF